MNSSGGASMLGMPPQRSSPQMPTPALGSAPLNLLPQQGAQQPGQPSLLDMLGKLQGGGGYAASSPSSPFSFLQGGNMGGGPSLIARMMMGDKFAGGGGLY
jgi:hypothetical protein